MALTTVDRSGDRILTDPAVVGTDVWWRLTRSTREAIRVGAMDRARREVGPEYAMYVGELWLTYDEPNKRMPT